MTICVGVKVNDGIVFVADSASSLAQTGLNGQQIISRVYNHGNKVFNLYRGLPIAAMTCGLGAFGSESISTIAKGIRVEMMSGGIDPKNYNIEQVTTFARERFLFKFQALDANVRSAASFEFIVGGCSSENGGGEIWKFQFTNGDAPEPVCIVATGQSDIIWAGQPEACVRLVLGISSQTFGVLMQAGLNEEQSTALVQAIRAQSTAQLVEPAMPIRDAIALGEFLAQTTASFVKFLPGADTVGGDLDIATVTKYEGFRWIRRKHFYPPELNRETDHVR